MPKTNAMPLPEAPKRKKKTAKSARPSDAELIALSYSPEAGWKNSHVIGPYWRVNHWVRTTSGCGNVAESLFVEVTADGIVVIDKD